MDFATFGRMTNEAVSTAVKAEREKLKRELAKALGFNTCPETTYLGTIEDLIAIARKHREQLANIRRCL